jgi:SNF2 family DNA or RNA helicase
MSEIEPTMRTSPMLHQINTVRDGYPFLRDNGFIALYDYEMGLGKTYVSIWLSLCLKLNNLSDRLIIIAPKTICSTWIDQLDRHADLQSVLLWDSQKAKTDKYKYAFKDLCAADYPIFIINIEAFQLENEILTQYLKYFSNDKTTIILDEAVKVKTYNSNRTKRLLKLFKNSPYKIGLSGKSITESPLDIFTMYQFLKHDFWPFKNYFAFRSYFAILQKQYLAEGRTFEKVVGFQRIDELTALVKHCTFRAKKEDCLSLPPKIHVTLPVELASEESRIYSELKKNLLVQLQSGVEIAKPAKIALFSAFRLITGGWASTSEYIGCGSKLKVLTSDLEDTSERAIIFCEFRHIVNQVAESLMDIGLTVTYTGMNSPEENERNKVAFESGKARFFVSDTGMGARGLNLQHGCSLIYYFDMPTSGDEFFQSQDRIHRIGQINTCVYKYLIVKDSVDDRIKTILDNKQSISDAFANGTLADLIRLV